MRSDRKKPKSDLRNYHTVFIELGMIVVLLIFIVAMKIDIKPGNNNKKQKKDKKETVKVEKVVQTKQKKTPPPPPKPQVPVPVPNDQIVKEKKIEIDQDIDFDQPLTMPKQGKKVKKDTGEKIFVAVEHNPELIGGMKALQKKINYPERAKESNIQGKVIVQFVVDKQGNVQDPHVLRGIGGGCDKEALRVIKQAKFKPGRQRGKPVNVKYSVPITFRLR